MLSNLLQVAIGLGTAFFVGTLVEYVVHRLMHARVFLYKIHAQHHQANQGQGWLLEFKDYFLPSTPVLSSAVCCSGSSSQLPRQSVLDWVVFCMQQPRRTPIRFSMKNPNSAFGCRYRCITFITMEKCGTTILGS